MGVFDSHRVATRVVASAQRAHVQHSDDDVRVQRDMTDLFEAYLARKKPGPVTLDKAQALLRRHVTNRTDAEKRNFTASLFGVCGQRDAAFAAARRLAQVCEMARSMALDQAVADVCSLDETVDFARLERAYTEVLACERIDEAFTFFLARNVSVEDMQAHVTFFDDARVAHIRKNIATWLEGTPEARPVGLEFVGRSVENSDLQGPPAQSVAEAPEGVEARVRTLCEATWSAAISTAGFEALCRNLTVVSLDLLLAHVTSEAYGRLLQACSRFMNEQPGVHRPAVRYNLGEALRDRLPARRRRHAHTRP